MAYLSLYGSFIDILVWCVGLLLMKHCQTTLSNNAVEQRCPPGNQNGQTKGQTKHTVGLFSMCGLWPLAASPTTVAGG
jgi:hypothetical protein